jgi:hypothetical protein
MMRNLFFLVMLFFSLSLLGCASSTPKQVSVKTEGEFEHNITIGYKVERTLPDGYYLLIEDLGSQWIIKKISEKPIVGRQNTQQEVLYINKGLTYLQPYFEKVKYFNGYTFECSPLLDDKKSYTPCNSNLMTVNVGMSIGKNIFSAVTTLGVASGSHKAIDREKIADIVQKTNMITKIREYQQQIEDAARECNRLKQIVESFRDKIAVKPQIIDKSGFYTEDAKIVSINNKIVGDTCPINLDRVEYVISINQAKSNFKVNIEPNSYVLRYNSEGYELKPSITIISKDFEKVYPQYFNEDDAIRIEFDGKNIRLINKTDKYIQIWSITVYYNSKVSNHNFGEKSIIELPPRTFSRELLIETFTNADIVKNSHYFNLTADLAKKQYLSFGFAIKYRLVDQHIDKTLYKLNTYNLYSVLSQL